MELGNLELMHFLEQITNVTITLTHLFCLLLGINQE